MAAWLLRSSRLGALKFDSWGTLRRQPPGLFCSEAKESVKPVKNTKDPDKTGEDERAAMWTYKTTVAFPVKLLEPGILPNFLGVTKEPVHFTATSEKTAASVTASTKSAGENHRLSLLHLICIKAKKKFLRYLLMILYRYMYQQKKLQLRHFVKAQCQKTFLPLL
ncbi:uncharacterized protein LOC129356599 isoform X1 [Poeciliopsis prolifica]|uniref:uncharacterized protein LOC129356599 isoform X1 n=1 Tax=Poeciliopsis prolifica TaxID=188132 RepID=UPI0024145C6F|nr:uncharacterized protein LOC129356599 isoform X1 [Poeciliopsis prolifica]